MNEILWHGSEKDVFEYFLGMTNQEAQAFFEQYLKLREERLNVLRQRFDETQSGGEIELDFTPESLVPLWRWASSHFTLREHTAEELKHIMQLPEWFREYQLTTKDLSPESKQLLIDIAYYFAEVFVRNHAGIQWEICKPRVKRDGDGNQPVLTGFKVAMNPRRLVDVAARKTLSRRAGEDELLRLYYNWSQNLPPPAAMG